MQKPGLFGMNGLLIFLLSCLSFTAHAQQQGYLILLETENRQPFSVRLGDQQYVSSGQGHLVLSHLHDSLYRINILFPKQNRGELVFPVVVHQKDQGFQLKGSDSVWVLYNWQTKETIHSITEKDSSRILDQGVKREDGFSRLMAAVVNDSAVMYNTYSESGFAGDSVRLKGVSPKSKTDIPAASVLPVPVIPPVVASPAVVRKPAAGDSLLAVKRANHSRDSLMAVNRAAATRDSLSAVRKAAATGDSLLAVHKPAAAKDSGISAVIPPAAKPVPPPIVRPQPPLFRPSSASAGIKKLREVSLKISRKLVFLDTGKDGVTDTITLFVYFETPDVASKIAAETDKTVKKTSNTDSTSVNSAEARSKLAERASVSGCGQLATDPDLEFLRSAILRANTEPDKISLAESAFGQKCFSVAQVRVLAALFVSDKARYRLMEAAHGHIADPDHFKELSDMYTDKNFQRKFLTMAGKAT